MKILPLALAALMACGSANAQTADDVPETVSIQDTTLLAVREEAIVIAKELQLALVAYEGSAQEIEMFAVDMSQLVARDGIYYQGEWKVADASAFQLKMAMRLTRRLNWMQEVVEDRFKATRLDYCTASYQVELLDGEEVGIQKFVARRGVSADKAKMFCTVSVPRIVPYL